MSTKFKDRLIEAMKIRNIKSAELAKKSGLSKAQISQYINGIYEAKQIALYKLAITLDVNEAWLMGHDVIMEREPKITELSAHEKKVITAYKEQPEMQPAVDKILGVKK